MPSEFTLINRYFKRPTCHTVLGAGDDGAIVRPAAGMDLVVSTDMLVAGTHFLATDDARELGWKVLAVNVSDMAAMGAVPRWALLAAAMPSADEPWIAQFAQGFFACAEEFGIDLIGGDTTKGPLNFCVTIFGEVPHGRPLLRAGARPGDDIWISGQPGLAALGLAHKQGRVVLEAAAAVQCLAALQRPQPRVELGLALRGIASSAIDVSDGVLADLGHILEESKVAAILQEPSLPYAFDMSADAALVRDCLRAGGDDYELLFTAPAARHGDVALLADTLQLALTCIGSIVAGEIGALKLLDNSGRELPLSRRGYDHFSSGAS